MTHTFGDGKIDVKKLKEIIDGQIEVSKSYDFLDGTFEVTLGEEVEISYSSQIDMCNTLKASIILGKNGSYKGQFTITTHPSVVSYYSVMTTFGIEMIKTDVPRQEPEPVPEPVPEPTPVPSPAPAPEEDQELSWFEKLQLSGLGFYIWAENARQDVLESLGSLGDALLEILEGGGPIPFPIPIPIFA